MSQRKSDRLFWAFMVGVLAFITTCFLSMSYSQLFSLRMKQSGQLIKLSTSISPDNLPLAGEIFQTGIAVEASDFPVEKMVRLKAWKTLQGTLAAYAERLKLLQAQSEELDRQLQRRMLWSSYVAVGWSFFTLVLTVLGIWQQRKNRRVEVAEKNEDNIQ